MVGPAPNEMNDMYEEGEYYSDDDSFAGSSAYEEVSDDEDYLDDESEMSTDYEEYDDDDDDDDYEELDVDELEAQNAELKQELAAMRGLFKEQAALIAKLQGSTHP